MNALLFKISRYLWIFIPDLVSGPWVYGGKTDWPHGGMSLEIDGSLEFEQGEVVVVRDCVVIRVRYYPKIP